MVRINLLRERTLDQPAPVTKAPIEPKPIQTILIIAVLFVAAVAFGTWWWWKKYSELNRLQRSVSELTVKAAQLKPLEQKLQEYEALNNLLKVRKEAIEQLKQNQNGPVEMMNTLVRSLPEKDPLLWLSKVERINQPTSEVVKIEGFGMEVGAMIDFMTALQKTNYFTEVDLIKYEKSKIPLKFQFECRRKIEGPVAETATKPAGKEAKNGKKR